MTLPELWFILITVLWTGFFILEGFDLGVGMLHGHVGKTEAGKKAAVGTIGPLWDGNEVWLVVAAAAMFAAFPGWYATTFSSAYLLVLLLLVALIGRGVSFEYRDKHDSLRWHRTWDFAMTAGSVVVPLMVGIILGSMLNGLPIDSSHEFTGTIADLLQPYPIFFGLTLVVLCLLHGSAFLWLKTSDDLEERSARFAGRIAPLAALVVTAFVIWTHILATNNVLINLLQITAIIGVIAAWWLIHEKAAGWAFVATCLTIATTVLGFFADLYPRLMVSSTDTANNLTVDNTASGDYALKVMTVITVIFLPLVLLYQGWTYYVFRKRVRTEDFEVSETQDAHH